MPVDYAAALAPARAPLEAMLVELSRLWGALGPSAEVTRGITSALAGQLEAAAQPFLEEQRARMHRAKCELLQAGVEVAAVEAAPLLPQLDELQRKRLRPESDGAQEVGRPMAAEELVQASQDQPIVARPSGVLRRVRRKMSCMEVGLSGSDQVGLNFVAAKQERSTDNEFEDGMAIAGGEDAGERAAAKAGVVALRKGGSAKTAAPATSSSAPASRAHRKGGAASGAAPPSSRRWPRQNPEDADADTNGWRTSGVSSISWDSKSKAWHIEWIDRMGKRRSKSFASSGFLGRVASEEQAAHLALQPALALRSMLREHSLQVLGEDGGDFPPDGEQPGSPPEGDNPPTYPEDAGARQKQLTQQRKREMVGISWHQKQLAWQVHWTPDKESGQSRQSRTYTMRALLAEGLSEEQAADESLAQAVALRKELERVGTIRAACGASPSAVPGVYWDQEERSWSVRMYVGQRLAYHRLFRPKDESSKELTRSQQAAEKDARAQEGKHSNPDVEPWAASDIPDVLWYPRSHVWVATRSVEGRIYRKPYCPLDNSVEESELAKQAASRCLDEWEAERRGKDPPRQRKCGRQASARKRK